MVVSLFEIRDIMRKAVYRLPRRAAVFVLEQPALEFAAWPRKHLDRLDVPQPGRNLLAPLHVHEVAQGYALASVVGSLEGE